MRVLRKYRRILPMPRERVPEVQMYLGSPGATVYRPILPMPRGGLPERHIPSPGFTVHGYLPHYPRLRTIDEFKQLLPHQPSPGPSSPRPKFASAQVHPDQVHLDQAHPKQAHLDRVPL